MPQCWGFQSNPWDTKDEVEGVDTNEDAGIEAETSSFSKLLLAAKVRRGQLGRQRKNEKNICIVLTSCLRTES
jgi:hypothetical protein